MMSQPTRNLITATPHLILTALPLLLNLHLGAGPATAGRPALTGGRVLVDVDVLGVPTIRLAAVGAGLIVDIDSITFKVLCGNTCSDSHTSTSTMQGGLE